MTTQYTLLDPLTGDTSTLTPLFLTRNLQLNRILLRENEPIGIITYRDLVSFCRWCAGQILSREIAPPEARAALALVDRWLFDPKSVSSEELNKAAAQAAPFARASARAARAAARAARAASNAVGAAANAVGAATGAAGAANAARDAKAAGVSFEAQARWFLEHLKSAQ